MSDANRSPPPPPPPPQIPTGAGEEYAAGFLAGWRWAWASSYWAWKDAPNGK